VAVRASQKFRDPPLFRTASCNSEGLFIFPLRKGMYAEKKPIHINAKRVLYPHLCRDPVEQRLPVHICDTQLMRELRVQP
jgi:hypothetical protein